MRTRLSYKTEVCVFNIPQINYTGACFYVWNGSELLNSIVMSLDQLHKYNKSKSQYSRKRVLSKLKSQIMEIKWKRKEAESHIQSKYFGKRFVYSSKKGEISMIGPCFATCNQYEIYDVGETDLFNDIERYDTLEEVEKRISELLN